MLPCRKPRIRALPDLRSSILLNPGKKWKPCQKNAQTEPIIKHRKAKRRLTNSWVLILSKGVTAKSDSVKPAPNPAITVLGPDILPFSSCSNDLNVSNATNPCEELEVQDQVLDTFHRGTNPMIVLTYSRLKSISHNQCSTSSIPLSSERGPGELL